MIAHDIRISSLLFRYFARKPHPPRTIFIAKTFYGQEVRMSQDHRDLWENPMATDGFEFVEYTAPNPDALAAVFERMGFTAVAEFQMFIFPPLG